MIITSYIALLEYIGIKLRPADGLWIGSFVRMEYNASLDMNSRCLDISGLASNRFNELMRLGYPVAMINESTGRYVIHLKDDSLIDVISQLLVVNTRTMFQDTNRLDIMYCRGYDGLINSVIVPRLLDCNNEGVDRLRVLEDRLGDLISQCGKELTLYECICNYPNSVKDIARILDHKHHEHYIEDLMGILDEIGVNDGSHSQMIQIEYDSYLGRLRFFDLANNDISSQVIEHAKTLNLKSLEIRDIEGVQSVFCGYHDILRDLRIELFKMGVTQTLK